MEYHCPGVIMKEIMKLIINIFKMIQTCRQPHKKLYMFMRRKNGDHTRYNGGGLRFNDMMKVEARRLEGRHAKESLHDARRESS